MIKVHHKFTMASLWALNYDHDKIRIQIFVQKMPALNQMYLVILLKLEIGSWIILINNISKIFLF